jgi:thioredoxin reductase (NADPH)
LADSAYRQAQRLGAEFLIGVLVLHARPQEDGSVEVEFTSGSTIRARSGLIATGVVYRRLDIPAIERLIGRGVRYGSHQARRWGMRADGSRSWGEPTRPDGRRFTSPATPPK